VLIILMIPKLNREHFFQICKYRKCENIPPSTCSKKCNGHGVSFFKLTQVRSPLTWLHCLKKGEWSGHLNIIIYF